MDKFLETRAHLGQETRGRQFEALAAAHSMAIQANKFNSTNRSSEAPPTEYSMSNYIKDIAVNLDNQEEFWIGLFGMKTKDSFDFMSDGEFENVINSIKMAMVEQIFQVNLI